MSEKSCNGWLTDRMRFLVLFAGAIAAVVLAAWRSQARQDEKIHGNEKAVALMMQRLESIDEKLEDIRDLLLKGHRAANSGPDGGLVGLPASRRSE